MASDGHCGYRAVAAQIYGNEDMWAQVRTDCYNEVHARQDLYQRVLTWINVNELLRKIACYVRPIMDMTYWMDLPELGHIIATRYNVAFISYSASGGNLCLPVTVPAGVGPPINTVVLGQVTNHFILV